MLCHSPLLLCHRPAHTSRPAGCGTISLATSSERTSLSRTDLSAKCCCCAAKLTIQLTGLHESAARAVAALRYMYDCICFALHIKYLYVCVFFRCARDTPSTDHRQGHTTSTSLRCKRLVTKQQAVVLEVDVVHDEQPGARARQRKSRVALPRWQPPCCIPHTAHQHQVRDHHAAALCELAQRLSASMHGGHL